MQVPDFPGNPVVKDFAFQDRGFGFDPWSVGELRFHMFHDQKIKT